jgi:hypothetical protein
MDPKHIPTVNSLWLGYKARMYKGQKLGLVQEEECRQAYFCGAGQMIELLSQMSAALPVEGAVKELEKLNQEILKYLGERYQSVVSRSN